MSGVIGVFVGSASSFNIGRTTKNIGRALSEEFTTHLISTENKFAEGVSSHYDRVHGVSEAGSILGETNALRSYLKSFHPDALFQITQPPIHGTIVGSVAAVYDVPFVYRYSGDRFYEYKMSRGFNKIAHFGLNNIVGRIPLNLASACISLGPTGKSRLMSRVVTEERIKIIPPIIDAARFSPNGPQAEFDTDQHIGLFVGRVTRRKGKATIERTLPEILDRRQDIQFAFVGEQLDPLDIPPQYREHITMVGPVSPEEMPKYYRAASFIIHPSLSEGVPRAVLEANATGTPTIARDVGDVVYVTENVFQSESESEFVDYVCGFEKLTNSSTHIFKYDKIKIKYHTLFESFV
jgi:glycosyltransferase involved in cell wall biosynthesis